MNRWFRYVDQIGRTMALDVSRVKGFEMCGYGAPRVLYAFRDGQPGQERVGAIRLYWFPPDRVEELKQRIKEWRP